MSIFKRLLRSLVINNYSLFFIFICMISLGSIAFAYFVEFILGFEPCILCLYQRIPYYLMAFLSIAALILQQRRRCMLILLSLVFFSSLLLAAYHTGIERGIINPTDKCNSGDFITESLSNEELLAKLYAAPIADCSKPAFKIFAISMTEWNLILSLFLFIISYLVIRHKR